MAKQGISTGTTPNDGSGDSLLAGAVKINSNFDEVYAAIGNGSTVSTPVTSITAGDNITVSGSTGSVTITGIGTADIDTDRINVSGVVTASSFSGSGANLTNLPAAALTGTLPALDGSNLTGVTASGVGVTVQDGGSGKGTASIINFGANLSVTTVNSGIATITAGAANTANLNSDTIVVGVLTATTFAGDLTLNTGDLLLSAGGINATTSSENLNWGSGNFYFNSGSPELAWVGNSGNIRAGAGGAGSGVVSIKVGNPGENSGVFREGGAAELYYDNSKKFETTGSGTTTYGTALTQQLNVTGVSTFTGNVSFGSSASFGDLDKLKFGDGEDLQIYHHTANYFDISRPIYFRSSHGSGSQFYFQATSGENSLILNHNGSVELYYDNSKKFETLGTGVTVLGTTDTQQIYVSGVSTFIGNVTFGNTVFLGNNDTMNFGANGNDLQLYHTGIHGYVVNNTGNFYLTGGTNGNVIIRNYNKDSVVANYSGSVDLYYDGSKKLETTGYGVTITGGVYASGISTFIGNVHVGSGITFTSNNDISVTGVSTFFGNVIIGQTRSPENQRSGMILNGGGTGGGSINFTGPNTTDVNDSYYPNIRLALDEGNFRGDLEFHSNGYTGVGTGAGDFVFFKRHTSYGRAERMRLEGETGNLTLSGTSSGGICSATSFYGDGSDLADGKWTLGADGSSNYTFTGIGFTQTTNDPILYLARGRVYEFVNTMGAHPFEIRESAGGSAFDRGVTNNAVSNGTLRFEIPFDAPNTLYYQCTSHSGMGSTIVVYPNTI